MRNIKKGDPSNELRVRNTHPPENRDEAIAAWDNFRSQSTKKICLQEQYGLCGYSEVPLYESHSCLTVTKELGMHVEHIKPKSIFPELTFEHDNLIVSAISDEGQRTLSAKDVFGGHAKDNWYDPERFITPLSGACSTYFHYNINGEVTPKESLSEKEKEYAKTTIAKLNLNSPILIVWRKSWIEEASNIIDELLGDNVAIEKFANAELSLSHDYKLRAFHSSILQLFGKYGEKYKV